jgi:hypothetical protein
MFAELQPGLGQRNPQRLPWSRTTHTLPGQLKKPCQYRHVACAAIVAALQQKPWCSAHWNLHLLISPALRRELAGERTQKNVHIDRSPLSGLEAA